MSRVLILVGKGILPPRSLDGLSDQEIAQWKMEYDVMQALEDRGHTVHFLDVSHDLTRIRTAIEEHKPGIVFNLLEDFLDQPTFDAHVVAYLELLEMRYTGCNPRGLLLSRDKALTKKICAYHRVAVPRFAVFRRGRRARAAHHLEFPVIVKALVEDASRGISQASVVGNQEQLARRVEFIHEQIHDDAIAEEYIEGRELYLGMLGNERLTAFPLLELDLDRLPEGVPRIATARMKWDLKYQAKHQVFTHFPKDLPEGFQDRAARLGKRIYRMLGLTGYARLDFRLRADGRLFLLEANANPDLSCDEDFGEAAEAAGLPYPTLIQRILGLGRRYRPGMVSG